MTLPKSGSIQSFSSTFFKFEIFCAGFTWINVHNKALFFPKFVTFYLVLVISAYNIDIQIGVRNTIKLDRPNLVVDYLKITFTPSRIESNQSLQQSSFWTICKTYCVEVIWKYSISITSVLVAVLNLINRKLPLNMW